MIASLVRYFFGYLKIRVSGHSTERFLNACRNLGIALWDIRVCPDDGIELCLYASGLRRLRPILRRTGVRLRVIGKYGLRFFAFRMRRRRLFAAGFAAGAVLFFLLSCFVWQIELDGNHAETDETILRFLAQQGVRGGMLRARVDCPEIVRQIRLAFDDIIWVSASTDGCRLRIQIKENEDEDPEKTDGTEETGEQGEETGEQGEETGQIEQTGQTEQAADSLSQTDAPYDLVADFDGVLVSSIVREGVAQVHIGDTVKAGDVLVAGQIPVENDADEITAYRYCRADADMTVQTEIAYENSCPNEKEVRSYYDVYKLRGYLSLFGFRFYLGELKNNYEYATLTGERYAIPFSTVSIGYQKLSPYRITQASYSQSEQQSILSEQFSQYQKELEEKGVEIIRNDVKIYTGSKQATVRGTLQVQRPIGVRQPSVIAEIPQTEENGEND